MMKGQNTKPSKASIDYAASDREGVRVVVATGEIGNKEAEQLNKAALPLKPKIRSVVFDLSNVIFMDASGFSVLMSTLKKCRERSGVVALAGCSEAIKRIMKVTRLDSMFAVADTVDEAIEKAQGTRVED